MQATGRNRDLAKGLDVDGDWTEVLCGGVGTKLWGSAVQTHVGQTVHDPHGLDTQGGDPTDEVDDVSRLMVFAGPVVGIVDSAGMALVVVGGALWVSRSAGQLLWPLASLGSMTLTGYTIHLVVLASVHVDHHPWLWFWGQVVLGILLAMAWQRAVGRGPIEAAVSRLSRLGAAVLVRPEGRRSRS